MAKIAMEYFKSLFMRASQGQDPALGCARYHCTEFGRDLQVKVLLIAAKEFAGRNYRPKLLFIRSYFRNISETHVSRLFSPEALIKNR
ncbi:MAG TPA: hypothetical protein PLN48_09375, partial [Lachnospiraceae bacterium]|nr:hypothetical protein [Lachnospiraceae bacterium]